MIVAPLKITCADKAFVDDTSLLVAAFDAVPAHIALIDENGVILAVNAAWRGYADANGLTWADYGVGYNYLSSVSLAGNHDDAADAAARGLVAVLRGDSPLFVMSYVCPRPSPTWFEMRVTPFGVNGHRYAVVSHTDITEAKRAEAELQAAREMVEAAKRRAHP